MEPIISALGLAFVASLALAVLIAAASHARTGLRGRRLYLLSGFGLGLLAGLVELVIAVQLAPVAQLAAELSQSVWLELAAVAAVAAFSYVVIVGVVFQLGLFIHRRRARRRGDVVALAAGMGCGLAVTATALRLLLAGIWPPSALFVAVIYPPLQLGYVLLLAAATLAARDGLGWRALGWQTIAILVQAGYQFVLHTNDTVGHWLAWLEPAQLRWLWLLLVALAWALGLALMAALARAEPDDAFRPAEHANGLLEARLWLWLAALVLVPTSFALAFSLGIELDTGATWVMVLALLATPVMAGVILLQTAFSLKPPAMPPKQKPASPAPR